MLMLEGINQKHKSLNPNLAKTSKKKDQVPCFVLFEFYSKTSLKLCKLSAFLQNVCTMHNVKDLPVNSMSFPAREIFDR